MHTQPSNPEASDSPHGQTMFAPEVWTQLADRLNISPRELQVVQLIFDDLKELAIAQTLDISQHTVHTHIERLCAKLGVSSRLALVTRVVAEYLLAIETHAPASLPPVPGSDVHP